MVLRDRSSFGIDANQKSDRSTEEAAQLIVGPNVLDRNRAGKPYRTIKSNTTIAGCMFCVRSLRFYFHRIFIIFMFRREFALRDRNVDMAAKVIAEQN